MGHVEVFGCEVDCEVEVSGPHRQPATFLTEMTVSIISAALSLRLRLCLRLQLRLRPRVRLRWVRGAGRSGRRGAGSAGSFGAGGGRSPMASRIAA